MKDDEQWTYEDEIHAKAAAYDELCAAIGILFKRLPWYGFEIGSDNRGIHAVADGSEFQSQDHDGTPEGAIAAIIRAAKVNGGG